MKKPIRGTVAMREVGSDMATFEEIFQQEVYKRVLRQVAGLKTLIDLGANIGLASLYLTQNAPDCRVLAVEPHPDTYTLLEHNLQPLIRAGRCRTLRAAVWGAHGDLSVVPGGEPDWFSMFSVREAPTAAIHLKVTGYTVPELLEYAGFNSVDLLKIDVEGSELELFKGNPDWLDRVGSMAVEFHGKSREMCMFDDIMKAGGFELLEDGHHTVLAVRPR